MFVGQAAIQPIGARIKALYDSAYPQICPKFYKLQTQAKIIFSAGVNKLSTILRECGSNFFGLTKFLRIEETVD